jgi:ribose transport system permease protein
VSPQQSFDSFPVRALKVIAAHQTTEESVRLSMQSSKGGIFMGSEKGLKKFLKTKEFTLLIIFIMMIAVFTVWCTLAGKTFLSADTFLSIVDMLVVTSFLAIGAACLLLTGKMDLSIVSIGCVAGLFVAVAIKNWLWPWPLALLAALVACGVFGLVNSALVNEFNMQPFIATMATSYVFKGIQMWVSWDAEHALAQNIAVDNPFLDWLGTYQLFGVIPITVVLMILAFIVYGVMLKKTKFGTMVYLVGGNPQAARLSGLNPKRISYILYANSGVMAALSGIVLLARTSQASQLALSANMFTGLIAAVLGGISFFGGNGGMTGVFLGLCILNTFSKGMTIVNFDAIWSTPLQGLVLAIALSLDFSRGRRLTKSVSKKVDSEPEKITEKAGTGR